ncbi:hypothetical protein N7492_008651 [Penicillium capsulatum]|uniref:Uncharacterized protein n=1 Tax=Penicillium capsulatum TaxID=69766 RepID=A0A9W9LH52_9EURO|nr:hypothetical protein N7492_008651 [Penicillium capsulatum]KAJ6106055.1 hypothetical protein N7512_009572 [Penicillium capsulatum]
MQATSIQFSPAKDGRRILGEKDANACLSPARHSKHALAAATTPVKRAIYSTVSPKKLLPSPVFAGQKRTREQVDETDVNSGHVQEPRGHRPQSSQSPIQVDDKPQNSEVDAVDIHHPTPPRSDDPIPPQMDIENASQGPRQDPESVPDDLDARKVFIQQKATLLRNRLQTAMRNVTDHQIDRRVSELEVHSRKCPRISLSSFSSPCLSLRKTATPSQFRTPRIGMPVDLSSTPSQQTPDLPTLRSLPDDSSRAKTSPSTPPRTLGSPMQLSSPPATVVRFNGNGEGEEDRDPVSEEAKTRNDLSPSQRGDAVDGLLKLMSTDRNDSSDVWSG